MHRFRALSRLLLPGLLLLVIGQSLLLWHQLQDTLDDNTAHCELCLLAQGNSNGALPGALPPVLPRFFTLAIRHAVTARPRQRQPWLQPAGRGPPRLSFA